MDNNNDINNNTQQNYFGQNAFYDDSYYQQYKPQNSYTQQNPYEQPNTYTQPDFDSQNRYVTGNTVNEDGSTTAGVFYMDEETDTENAQTFDTNVPLTKETERKKKEKKPLGKFAKFAIACGCAVFLGVIGGAVAFGVNYAGQSLMPLPYDQQTSAAQPQGSGTSTVSPTQQAAHQATPITGGQAIVSDVSGIVDNVIDSVVQIEGNYTVSTGGGIFGTQTQKGTVRGSGFIIGYNDNDSELLIVTNAHVVENFDTAKITLYDGTVLNGTVKGRKAENDVAIVAINKNEIPAGANVTVATLGDSTNLKLGEAAIVIGNSLGKGITVTTGCISALDRSLTVDKTQYEHLIQTDAAINSGNSGGALFNARGEVVGISSAKMSSTSIEGVCYAISISSVKDIIDELSTKETRYKYDSNSKGYLGITGVSVTADAALTYGYPSEGVMVRSVTPGSGAEKAGLEKGDIIVSVDGTEVKTIDELVDLLSYYQAGEEIEIKYYKAVGMDYELQTVKVVLSK